MSDRQRVADTLRYEAEYLRALIEGEVEPGGGLPAMERANFMREAATLLYSLPDYSFRETDLLFALHRMRKIADDVAGAHGTLSRVYESCPHCSGGGLFKDRCDYCKLVDEARRQLLNGYSSARAQLRPHPNTEGPAVTPPPTGETPE